MTFWSTETIKTKAEGSTLIHPYHPQKVKRGSYELAVGDSAYVTKPDEKSKKYALSKKDDYISIPPGQFAVIITLEKVFIPDDIIAFISVRSKYKMKGLVNVSGFHVDPGFKGALKFGVHNAGPSPISLNYREDVFSIWFCNFDDVVSDPYDGGSQYQSEINSEDMGRLAGKVLSPADLKKQIDDLRVHLRILEIIGAAMGSLLIYFIARF